MTCIIGLEHEGKVFMGADSAWSNGWEWHKTAFQKTFFRNQCFLIGVAGAPRFAQLMQYHLQITPQSEIMSDEEYMVVHFVGQVRQCVRENGFMQTEDGREHIDENRLLVGYKGKCYILESNFQLERRLSGLSAIGSASDYAQAAMVALANMQPMARITRSLEICTEFTPNVRPPFRVLELDV